MTKFMRILLLVTACVLASGCVQPQAQFEVQVEPQLEPEKVVNSDCYTVDLFTRVKVEKPAANVPMLFTEFVLINAFKGTGETDGYEKRAKIS